MECVYDQNPERKLGHQQEDPIELVERKHAYPFQSWHKTAFRKEDIEVLPAGSQYNHQVQCCTHRDQPPSDSGCKHLLDHISRTPKPFQQADSFLFGCKKIGPVVLENQNSQDTGKQCANCQDGCIRRKLLPIHLSLHPIIGERHRCTGGQAGHEFVPHLIGKPAVTHCKYIVSLSSLES